MMIFHKENPIAFPKSYENRKFLKEQAALKFCLDKYSMLKIFQFFIIKLDLLKGR